MILAFLKSLCNFGIFLFYGKCYKNSLANLVAHVNYSCPY